MTSVDNPLVAPVRESTTWHTGTGLLDDIATLVDAIRTNSWVDAGLDVAGGALDALAMAFDPLGSLLAWGVGWLLEHVRPLQDALDALAGNPDAVTAQSQTWTNISECVAQAQQAFGDAVDADTSGWAGAAGDAYRGHVTEHAAVLNGIATATGGISAAVSGAGVVVALVRGIVSDLIAQFVATLAARLPEWLAEEGFTFGLATPAVVGQVASLVAKWANKIQRFIRALLNSIRQLRPLLGRLGENLGQLTKQAKRLARSNPVEIKIGSLNTGGLRRMDNGREDLSMFRNAFTPADLWFFQEDHSREGVSLAGKIADEFGMDNVTHTPASTSFLDSTYEMGNTLAVGPNVELRDFSTYRYPDPDFPLTFNGQPVEPLGRYLEVAKLAINGTEYTAVNVHFPPMDALGYKGGYLEGEGARYARVLEDFVLEKVQGDRVLVAGDFNVDDVAKAFPKLVEELGLKDALAGVRATVPWGTHPDHILVPSRDFKIVEAQAVRFGADHYRCTVILKTRS
ncbi:hypothetical protein GCM10023322_38890 [Rugosimonospora acidiphila]|uniref:Endonuclease/exonuclease/phosphatase domain-containing protein n=1 Tax=Rugosimonospora acidiphila TaxID=556531 RepID=A0ABP9RY49_9ACTN